MALLTDDERDEKIIRIEEKVIQIEKAHNEHQQCHKNYALMIWSALITAFISLFR